MYELPSRYVLSRSLLDSEAARVQLEDEASLQGRQNLTLLCDGWDDAAGRSIYATLAVEVQRPPILLGLTDMTGQRANTFAILKVNEDNLASMNVNPLQIAGLCTDNPTTMVAMRREWEKKYPKTIVYGCRLHQINILLGKISAYMKDTTKLVTRLVSFFNRSHVYSGKLADKAKKLGVTRGLVIHTETRWYATALMFKSALAHQ